jgi:hypothetical protein
MPDSDFLQIVDLLIAARIPVVVIGGHAVNVHGYIRATEDIDLLFQRTTQIEMQLLEVLSGINAYYIGEEIDPKTGIETTHRINKEFIRSNHLMMLGSDLGYVDLFDFVPAIPDASVSDVIASAITVSGRPFVNLAWLRRMKQAAGRAQDKIDLQHLPQISN